MRVLTGAEELYRIADRFAFIYPDEALALMRLADEHRRMSEALDEIVALSFSALRGREKIREQTELPC